MPRFERLLVAVDGSEPARHALLTALDIAEAMGAELEAIGVEGPLPRYAATIGEVDEVVRERAAFFADVLSDARAVAAERGVELSTSMRTGHPAEVIVHHAAERAVDLIIVGHKSHFLHDFLLGSTAARVTRHAHCPVLVVR
ncbi:MAG: universal stress protein [Actinobacteria bacterium]|nr:universal stress protein [Actinomycetota bacterium]